MLGNSGSFFEAFDYYSLNERTLNFPRRNCILQVNLHSVGLYIEESFSET